MSIRRRRFLQALGLGGAGLALPSLRRTEGARAQMSPKRLVIFTTDHGAPRGYWKMNPPSLPQNTDGAVALATMAQSELSHVLEPLYDVRSRLTVVEGLTMTSAMLDKTGNNHGVAWAHLLTNQLADYNNAFRELAGTHPRPRGRSIDRYLGSKVATPGMIPSLEWGRANRFGVGFGFSTDGDGNWITLEREPANAFSSLFPNGPPSSEPVELTRRDRIAQQRASVLDAAGALYDQTIPKLSTEDRMKLEQHRAQIRELELLLQADKAVPMSCDPSYDSSASTYERFFRLAAVALSCDVTRVITISHGQLRPEDFGAAPGDVHQDYAHSSNQAPMGDYYRYHAGQFRSLLRHLDAVPEGNGTLLDNTMVIWLTELATGPHDFPDGLTVVAGGGAGGLHPGRYLRFAQNRPSACDTYGCLSGADMGLAHSHLFVSAMQFMGLSENSFGLTRGTAVDGSTIDLTGPLPML